MINFKNFIINNYERELGVLSPSKFISNFYANRINCMELNKEKIVETLDFSVTWFSLDTIDYRYLLTAKSNGCFICLDLLKSSENNLIEPIFKSSDKDSHKFSISCIQWYSFDTGMFFTSGMDELFKIWNTNSQKVISNYKIDSRIYSHSVPQLMNSNCNSLVALGLHNGLIRFIDLRSGSFSYIIKAHSENSCLNVKWSPIDGNVIASGGSDGKLFLWDVRSSKSFLNCFEHSHYSSVNTNITKKYYHSNNYAHEGSVLGISFTLNGNYLVSIGKDNHMRLWNVLSGLNTFVNYGKISCNNIIEKTSVQISCMDLHNNNYVFIPNGKNLALYNMFDGSFKKVLKGHFDLINCCLYNRNLNEVYTGSKDRNVLVWTAATTTEQEKNKTVLGFNSKPEILTNNRKRKLSQTDSWSDNDSSETF